MTVAASDPRLVPTRLSSACRDCGVAIRWLRHETTGAVAPITADARVGGNIIEIGDDQYGIIPPEEAQRLAQQGYSQPVNHFAECPAGRQRRKPKR